MGGVIEGLLVSGNHHNEGKSQINAIVQSTKIVTTKYTTYR